MTMTVPFIDQQQQQQQQRLSKMDTALNLLAGFSAEFQQAAHATRLQMNDGNSARAVDTESPSIPAASTMDEEFLAKVNALRKTIDYDSYQTQRDERMSMTVMRRLADGRLPSHDFVRFNFDLFVLVCRIKRIRCVGIAVICKWHRRSMALVRSPHRTSDASMTICCPVFGA